MRRALVPTLLWFVLILCAGRAPAQVTVTTPPPPVSIVDRNGIDLRGGKLARHHFELSIGAIDHPAIELVEGRTGAAAKIGTAVGGHVEQIHCDRATYNYCYRWRYVTFGAYAEWHLREGTDSESNRFVSASGGVYETAVGGGRLTLPDGTVVQYDSGRVPPYSCQQTPCPSPYTSEMFASAVRPDGEQVWSNARTDHALPGGRTVVRTSTGYAAVFGNGTETLYNVAVTPCDSTGQCAPVPVAWPTSTISSVWGFTDCASCDLADSLGHVAHTKFSADLKTREFQTRGGRTYSYTLKPYWNGFFQGLSTFSEGGRTTTYDYTIDPQSGAYDPRLIAAKATYPNGDTFSYRKGQGSGEGSYFTRYNDGPETEIRFMGGLAPNGQSGDAPLITAIVYPEGNGLTYTYDARRNRTAVRVSAKPASGQADLVSTASYPATCDQPKTCNKPDYVIDAAGNRTDYSYDPAHGGVLIETRPAGLNGVRPQTRYSYVQLAAHYFDESGQRVSGPPIWRLDHVSSCATRAECAGTADETVISYQFDDNLLPVVETRAAGDGSTSATTRRSYDAVGNLIAVDGPLPGDADTLRYAYDANRRLLRQVSPNPIDASPAAVLVKTLGYDEDDRVTTIVEGGASDSSDAAVAAFAPARATTISYDDSGRKQRETVSADGATQTVTQWSYDANGRAACTAVRMNRASFAALPDDACTLAPAGKDGADRITRTTYDTAGRVAAVQRAVGTPLEQRAVGYEYSANGKVAAIIDANGARAEMAYDGHDRLATWYLPSKREIGKVDRADYESYSYDANGNRLTLRRRDGRVLSLGYDALDRLVYKGVPAGCAPLQLGDCAEASATRNVYLDYDLRGLPTYARFDAREGEGLTFEHDALGRLTAATTALGGSRRVVSSGYDAAGNRVSLSTPAGSWRYGYDAASRLTALSDEAGTRLSTWSYDVLGRVAAVAEVGGSAASWRYDSLGRLTGQGDRFAGGTGDRDVTLGYNPAGQITGETPSSAAYTFVERYDVARGYAVNGQDQYDTAGALSLRYDANGNLIADGRHGYVYDAENRLVRAGEVSLRYDPLGRLAALTGGGVEREFLYDGDALVAEYGAGGWLSDAYVHGPGADEPLLWYHAGGAARWLHRDHEGSIVAVTQGGSGALRRVLRYDEHGIPGRDNIGRFQFTGQAWLRELGLYHYKARAYSPTLGRFLQTDPVGYRDQLNLYEYVGDDPVNKHDPSGESITELGFLAVNVAETAAHVATGRRRGRCSTTRRTSRSTWHRCRACARSRRRLSSAARSSMVPRRRGRVDLPQRRKRQFSWKGLAVNASTAGEKSRVSRDMRIQCMLITSRLTLRVGRRRKETWRRYVELAI